MSASMLKFFPGIAAIVFILSCPGRYSIAQPPLQEVGETIADRPSKHYRFEQFRVSSPDGERHWRVHLAIPKATAPQTGFPSFWMLDGNAALMDLDSALLEKLGAQTVPLALVFLSHESEFRIDSAARYRDYTPTRMPTEIDGPIQNLTGGADALLELIERKIRPQVYKRVQLDSEDQTLWGHSLGGVFVLHTLFTRTGAFQNYVAGSPSMWWGKGVPAIEAQRFALHNAGHAVNAAIHVGGREQGGGSRATRGINNPRVSAMLELRRSVPPDAAKQLVADLQGVGKLQVTYREFPELDHGEMFRASLVGGLCAAAGIEEPGDIAANDAIAR